MTISILPITPTVLSDNGTSVVSANAFNNGWQKLNQSAAGLVGKDSAGDSVLVTVGSGLSLASNTLTATGGGGGGTTVPGHLQGLLASRSSTTAIAMAAGVANVNGSPFTYAGATLTSASTMKDLNNATVTLGANKCYHIYIVNANNDIRVQDWSDGTWGGNPVYDSTLDYFKSPSASGANARRIGVFWTNGSSQILLFKMVNRGPRGRVFYNIEHASLIVLNGGTSTTYAAVTITPYVTGDVDALIIVPQGSGTAGQSLNWFASLDGGTTNSWDFRGSCDSGGVISMSPAEIPYSSTLHYKIAAGSASAFALLSGVALTA